jgi:hypothetical protein
LYQSEKSILIIFYKSLLKIFVNFNQLMPSTLS